MKLRRILSAALSAALLCSLLTLGPAASAASPSAFSDISDPNMAAAAETLRLLGIVGGTGGTAFEPNRILTRAEFCKIAVELMGQGHLVAGQMNRTVFKDVSSDHWARGYISVATKPAATSSGGDKETTTAAAGIIRGDPAGFFNPDSPITYVQAVTILLRILGYSDSDVGFKWPDSYLAMAQSLELNEGVALAADDQLTRGQAILLIDNLLYIEPKGSKSVYLTGDTLKCTITDEAVIYAVDATAPDGSKNAVKTSGDKLYKTDHAPFDADLVGRRAKLVLDKDGKALAVEVSETGTQKVVSILSATYNTLKVTGGEEIKIDQPTKAVVYRNGEVETTYDKLYLNLTAGTQAVLQYSAAGELEYIFLRSAVKTESNTNVIKSKPSTSAKEPAYAIYKNGVPATTKDYRQYDVTTFDPVGNVMYVSDLRVTGVYEDVKPSPETPAKVTVMGHEFDVLQSAYADLANFKPGQTVTLLLSYSGQVAGAVEPTVAKSTTVGQVVSVDKSSGNAVVSAINLKDATGQNIKLEGETSYLGTRADEMVGQLVTVSSATKGKLNLSRLTGNQASTELDVQGKVVGNMRLAENILYYERVGTSAIQEIQYKDLTTRSVPPEKISYVHKNYAGDIDIIVFDNATGDLYTYGFVKYTSGSLGEGMDEDTPATIKVENALHTVTLSTTSLEVKGKLGGVVAKPNGEQLASFVELFKVENVRTTGFDTEAMTVTTPSAIYPVSSKVLCYNDNTETWFDPGKDADDDAYKAALDQVRAYGGTVTLYLDKAPEDGGKVRIVVVE